MPKKQKYIDVTPTWRELIPVLVELAANGSTPESRQTAMTELYRMADALDLMNAKAKQAQA